MKIHWVATLVVLVIGYYIGAKYPSLVAKVGL